MLFFIVLILGSALSLPSNVRIYDVEISDVYFNQFITDYDKHYASEEEYQMRFQIFKKNLEDINRDNLRHGTTVSGINPFTDMTYEEFSQKMLGYKPSNSTEDLCKTVPVPADDPPAKLDYREKGVVTPVKDQGRCGACWAFSSIGLIESKVAINKNQLISLSEQQLVDCDKSELGCHGGIMANALSFLIENGGVELNADYPYKAKQNKICGFDSSKVKVQLTACNFLEVDSSAKSWKKALTANGPLSIGLYSGPELHKYPGGIFVCNVTDDPNHALLLVGYGEENGEEFWIIKNSWGTKWGENGYLRLKMTDNPCRMYDTTPLTVTIE